MYKIKPRSTVCKAGLAEAAEREKKRVEAKKDNHYDMVKAGESEMWRLDARPCAN